MEKKLKSHRGRKRREFSFIKRYVGLKSSKEQTGSAGTKALRSKTIF